MKRQFGFKKYLFMNPFKFFVVYKKNLANPLRNTSTKAYCTGDPWCTGDRSNTVPILSMSKSLSPLKGRIYHMSNTDPKYFWLRLRNVRSGASAFNLKFLLQFKKRGRRSEFNV